MEQPTRTKRRRINRMAGRIKVANLVGKLVDIQNERMLTDDQFANLIGLSPSGWRKIKFGETKYVNKATLKRIGIALNVKVRIEGEDFHFEEYSLDNDVDVLNLDEKQVLAYYRGLDANEKIIFIRMLLGLTGRDNAIKRRKNREVDE